MADDARDELARLRAELAAQRVVLHDQQVRLARMERPRRLPRRALPLVLVALLVALTPLGLRAAGSFTDLQTGSVHNANIQAIYDAGITTGCVPNVNYCPTDNVTRQEMASFLARTAGLGTNPPVANAKTAQTAAHAGSADTATTAANAGQLGGQPPSAYLPSSGDLTMRYAFQPLNVDNTSAATTHVAYSFLPTTTVTATTTGAKYVYLSLDRPTNLFGRALAVKEVTVCYNVGAGVQIIGTSLSHTDLATGVNDLITDNTVRPPTATNAPYGCYTVAPATATAVNGALILQLVLDVTNTGGALVLYQAALTLTPVQP